MEVKKKTPFSLTVIYIVVYVWRTGVNKREYEWEVCVHVWGRGEKETELQITAEDDWVGECAIICF